MSKLDDGSVIVPKGRRIREEDGRRRARGGEASRAKAHPLAMATDAEGRKQKRRMPWGTDR